MLYVYHLCAKHPQLLEFLFYKEEKNGINEKIDAFRLVEWEKIVVAFLLLREITMQTSSMIYYAI